MSILSDFGDLLALGGRPIRYEPLRRGLPEQDWVLVDIDMAAALALQPMRSETEERHRELGGHGTDRP